MTTQSFSGCHELPAGTCLHQTYRIQKVIGAGGFGITYAGIHKDTCQTFAIKEYFPSSLAVRNVQEGSYALQPFPEKNAEAFQKGRQRFLNEAKILKSLPDLESIVSIYDLFEENGTIYLVMEYIDGLTLGQYITENGPLTFPETAELMAPIIRSLSKIHEKGLLHRDISPDNLILGIDNRLHLIDFGAASKNIPGNRKNTVILKAGYAPPEQYIPNGSTGAWTDIYAICATMYFALTGVSPSESIERLDPSCPPSLSIPNLLPWQSALLEKGLQIRPADRFQTARELSLALEKASESAEDAVTELRTDLSKKDRARIHKSLHHPRPFRISVSFSAIIGVGAVILCAVLLFALSTHFRPPKQNEPPAQVPPNVSSSQAASTPSATSPLPSTPTPVPTPISSEQPTRAPDADLLTMPGLTGIKLSKAKKRIKKLDASIRINVSYVYSSSKKPGTVISQSVRKGSSFSKKQLRSLSLTVSKGKRPSATRSPEPKPAASKKPADYQVRDDNDLSSIPLK